MELMLAQPRGFCAGVERAIEIVERALQSCGAPVFVYHEIVHNGRVVDGLKARGAVFVTDIAEIPFGAVTVFSAHGVSNTVRSNARARELRVIDATCPMVSKVHLQAQRFAREGYELIVVGHHGHAEIIGTTGSVDGPAHVVADLDDVQRLPIGRDARVSYVTQTTLSVDDTREIIEALKRRWPQIIGPGVDDICYATFNRQLAVRSMCEQVDVVLVVGAAYSSNSNRLCEVARNCGRAAYLIDDATGLDPAWVRNAGRVGITAGASVPESLVRELCERLETLGAVAVTEMAGVRENVTFRLPAMPGVDPGPTDAEALAPAADLRTTHADRQQSATTLLGLSRHR
jgi:4-hydroxy-3-methylbut-2-enyl diphosphate reductase